MQTVSVRCPHCGKPNSIPPTAAGMTLQCPLCHKAYVAPPLAIAPAPVAAGARHAGAPTATHPRSGPLPPHLAPKQPEAKPVSAGPAPAEVVETVTPRRPPRGGKLVAILYGLVFCLLLGV